MTGQFKIVTNNSADVWDWKFYLNGQEITGNLFSFAFKVDANSRIPTVTLEIVAPVEIDGEFPAVIVPLIKELA